MSDTAKTTPAPRFMWWCSAHRARRYFGCTHHARYMGIIPGFIEPESGLWVSRSDLLNPVEDAVTYLWVWTRQMRGEEPDFMFAIGREISHG